MQAASARCNEDQKISDFLACALVVIIPLLLKEYFKAIFPGGDEPVREQQIGSSMVSLQYYIDDVRPSDAQLQSLMRFSHIVKERTPGLTMKHHMAYVEKFVVTGGVQKAVTYVNV